MRDNDLPVLSREEIMGRVAFQIGTSLPTLENIESFILFFCICELDQDMDSFLTFSPKTGYSFAFRSS